MKYTSQQINRFTWQEWNNIMYSELNNAGFNLSFMSNDLIARDINEDPRGFILELKEKEITYLKDIGLLNNGRCPMCGKPIYENPGRFTSGYNYNLHFQICQNCVSKGKRTTISPANNTGCLIAILLFPIYLIRVLIG